MSEQQHPAQAELLRGIKRNTAIVTGRQFGETHGMGIDATWFARICTGRTLTARRAGRR